MGRRGPAPKPTELKCVEGTYRRDRAPANEPRPAVRPPSCPTWLSREAKREWRRIVPELISLGLLTGLDRASLAAYCEAYGEWYEMRRVIRDEGAFQRITTQAGSTYIQAHPALTAKNNAIDRMRRWAEQFGLTPSARTRVEAAERERDEEGVRRDPASRWFGEGRKGA